MKMTVQEAIGKIKSIDSAIGWVENYDYNFAKDEHELDACTEIKDLLREYRSFVLDAKVDL